MKKIIYIIASSLLDTRLDKERFPVGSHARNDKIFKVADHMLKMSFYVVSVSTLYYMIKDTNFCHWSLGGSVSRLEFFDNFPCQKDIPEFLHEWYIIKIGYYSHEMLYHLIYHRKRYDFSELMTHHFITNVLVYFSFSTGAIKLGAAVMLLHDFSDIGVAVMKIVYEFVGFYGQLAAYVFMFTSFVYTRIIVFPFVVLYQFYLRYLESPVP